MSSFRFFLQPQPLPIGVDLRPTELIDPHEWFWFHKAFDEELEAMLIDAAARIVKNNPPA